MLADPPGTHGFDLPGCQEHSLTWGADICAPAGFRVLPSATYCNTMTNMEGISIKLPPSLSNALAAEARRRNVTQSVIVREALERCLFDRRDRADAPSCADLVQDLAGSIKSGRRDLATNKALLQAAVEAHSARGRKRRR
jgi:hypothetical protein